MVADLLNAFELFGQFSVVLSEISLNLLHKLVEEHLHDGEVVLELLHNLIADVIIGEQFVLLLREGFAVDLSFFQANVGFVCDHALPLGEHEDEYLSFVEGNIELFHGEAVVDFEREMVQKDGFVTFEQEPIFYLPDRVLLALGFLVLLSNRFVDVLLLGLVRVSGMHN